MGVTDWAVGRGQKRREMKNDMTEIRGRLRKYCLALGLGIAPFLLACQVSLHHLLTPLVPVFASEVIQTYLRFKDPTRVAKPRDKDWIMAVLGTVVLGNFIYNFISSTTETYRVELAVQIVAASIALLIFRKLKLNRNPIDDSIAIENSNNIADGMAECFYPYLKMAANEHEETLRHNAVEQDLYQKNNTILEQMFVLFPNSQENRCLIQHIRKMEGNDNEKMSVSINIKRPYIHEGNRRESNTHLIKIRRDVQQRGAGGDIQTDFIPGGGDREPRNLPSTVKQFIYMVAVDNKPLNALHDLKQRGKMPVNVFELTRKLYYEKLKALIDKDLKKVKGKNDEEYKKLELINLVCYDDKTEKGVFTKPILEKIDDGSMK